MFNSQKFLFTVFVVLFVVFISEIFYIFYYQPFIVKKTPLPAPTPTVSVKLNNLTPTPTVSVKLNNLTPTPTVSVKLNYIVGLSFVFDEKLASQSGDQVKKIILEAQKKKRDFISYTNLLKAVMSDAKDCVAEENCFQSDNTEKEEWKSDTDKDFPISISGPFVVRLNFSGNKETSGVSLNGRLSKSDEFWWQGIKNIFIGTGDNGKRLYIDAKSNGPDPFLLFDQTFENKIEGIYVLFNEKGNLFLVTDLSYNKIAFIDLNEATNNKFPDELFPDKQLYIGYNIAPLSDLIIYDFSIL
ncbi:MAG: hypothetical protein NUV58_05175 [Candidatus Roizmanbacteria bacterium]|nr:hypothetical protein [Candidatus Roizmanbacteria bacterium]